MPTESTFGDRSLAAMIERIRNSMARQGMLPPGTPTWVAVSGGVDSMVLLHVLHHMGHRCQVLHVDHGLRGAESDADRALVVSYCEELRIPCTVVRVDVLTRASTSGGSVQMAARELRYEAFRDAVAQGPPVLAMAHHRDDAIETFFLHLLRGQGVHGWKGIAPVSGPFFRPFLAVERSAIVDYARTEGIPFREDASNSDPKYLRSRVRHEVLPKLDDLRSGWRRVLGRDLDLLRELSHAAALQAAQFLAQYPPTAEGVVRLPAAALLQSGMPTLLIRTLLGEATPHPERLAEVLRALEEQHVGAVFPLADGRALHLDRETLVLHQPPPAQAPLLIESEEQVPVGAPLRLSVHEAAHVDLGQGPHVAWLHRAALHYPMELRRWRAGDRMRPIGLGGSKLVSDLLTDAKVPSAERAQALVLCAGNTIVWLVGFRVASGFEARPDSAEVLRMEWLPRP